MFCPKCGAQNPDGATFCATCGEAFAAPQATVQVPAGAPKVPGKGLGIASLVLGIVAFIIFGIPCSITGLVLGAVGLAKAKAAGMKNGMALAGVILSIVALGLTLVTCFLCSGLGLLF